MTTSRNGAAMVPADHLRPVATPSRVGQGTAVEQSRAVAEVQAAVLVAQQCPRDVEQAKAEMRRSCSEYALASRAFYRYNRGGGPVSGPSIQLARDLARCWGNIDYGIAELRRDDDAAQSEMKAWAWDQQTNARPSSIFIVPHLRDKRGGPERLTDLRDIYENNANMGARRLREQIFAVLPVWFVKEAEALCEETLEKGDGRPIEERVERAITTLGGFGVQVDQIERRLGRPRAQWNARDLADLTVVAQAIRQHETTADEEFPPLRVTDAEVAAGQPAAPPNPPPAASGPPAAPEEPWDRPAPGATPEADEAEPITVAALTTALLRAGRIDTKTGGAASLKVLIDTCRELTGVEVGKAPEIVADQPTAEQLLTKLQAEAEARS